MKSPGKEEKRKPFPEGGLDQKHRIEEMKRRTASDFAGRGDRAAEFRRSLQDGNERKGEDEIEVDRGEGGRLSDHFARGLDVRAPFLGSGRLLRLRAAIGGCGFVVLFLAVR